MSYLEVNDLVDHWLLLLLKHHGFRDNLGALLGHVSIYEVLRHRDQQFVVLLCLDLKIALLIGRPEILPRKVVDRHGNTFELEHSEGDGLREKVLGLLLVFLAERDEDPVCFLVLRFLLALVDGHDAVDDEVVVVDLATLHLFGVRVFELTLVLVTRVLRACCWNVDAHWLQVPVVELARDVDDRLLLALLLLRAFWIQPILVVELYEITSHDTQLPR